MMNHGDRTAVKITVNVDVNFYAVLQALSAKLGIKRDDLIEEAVKSHYQAEIADLVGVMQNASLMFSPREDK